MTASRPSRRPTSPRISKGSTCPCWSCTAATPDRPIADDAPLAVKLLRKGELKVYQGYPHGMATTHAEEIDPDILRFIED